MSYQSVNYILWSPGAIAVDIIRSWIDNNTLTDFTPPALETPCPRPCGDTVPCHHPALYTVQFTDIKRYRPLRGPSSSSCGGIWPRPLVALQQNIYFFFEGFRFLEKILHWILSLVKSNVFFLNKCIKKENQYWGLLGTVGFCWVWLGVCSSLFGFVGVSLLGLVGFVCQFHQHRLRGLEHQEQGQNGKLVLLLKI